MTSKIEKTRRIESEPVRNSDTPSRQPKPSTVPVFNDGLESLRSGDC